MNAQSAATPPDCDGPSVRQYLRAATSTLHARVDGVFPAGLGDATSYARYLIGMHRFAQDFESATCRAPRHSLWLSRDLHALGLAPLSSHDVQRPLADRSERAGWAYVMAGSSVGARQLVRGVRQLGHTPEHGACFLARHGSSDDWIQIQTRLAAFDINDLPTLACLELGARDAFARVATCFEWSFAVYRAPDMECNA